MKLPIRALVVVAGGALALVPAAPALAWHGSPAYQDGYNSGSRDGYRQGYSKGRNDGYSDGYKSGESAGIKKGYANGKSDGIKQGYASGKSDGIEEGIATGYADGFSDGREYEQTLLAEAGAAPALAGVPDLTNGMAAPSFDVGTDTVSKGTVSYSNSIGSADSFSVGAMTNNGATASATSTPDYNVTSKATFGIGNSTINQVIGTSIGTGTTIPSSPISGSFAKAYTPDTINNDVTVKGIGTDSTIIASSDSNFTSNVKKGRIKIGGELINSGAGSANGGAGGSIGTTTTASANSSQFVSSFAQAY